MENVFLKEMTWGLCKSLQARLALTFAIGI